MELIDFVIAAKKDGYALGSAASKLKFDDGFKGFVIENEKFKYTDKYTGFNPFCGSEIVTNKVGQSSPVWMMNYYGKSYLPLNESKDLYQFLTEAMSRIDRAYPFRGPSEYQKRGWRYLNNQRGEFNMFLGTEEIFFKERKVYELSYHGGAL